MNHTTILPGIGLGNIKFGIARDQLKDLLGEPNEIEKFSYTNSSSDLSETWHYDELDLSVGFDEEDDWRLISFAVTSKNYELKSKHLFGCTREELLNTLESLNIDDLEFEGLATIDNSLHESISSPSLGVNFWLDNEQLAEIQWSPLFNEDDSVDWPEGGRRKE